MTFISLEHTYEITMVSVKLMSVSTASEVNLTIIFRSNFRLPDMYPR